MSTNELIQQAAIQIANDIDRNASALELDLRKVEDRKAEIEAKLHSAKLSLKRLSNFHSEDGGDFQCPRCWISNETRSSLTPILGTDSEDIFRCRVCNFKISVPF